MYSVFMIIEESRIHGEVIGLISKSLDEVLVVQSELAIRLFPSKVENHAGVVLKVQIISRR